MLRSDALHKMTPFKLDGTFFSLAPNAPHKKGEAVLEPGMKALVSLFWKCCLDLKHLS
jgi:hypothetical protein